MVGLYELHSLHHICEQYSPSWSLAVTNQQNYKDNKLKDKKLFSLLDTKCQGNKKGKVEIPVDKRKCDLIDNTKSKKNNSYDWNVKITGVGLEKER